MTPLKSAKRARLIIYWDYELQTGADVSLQQYKDGAEDYRQTQFILEFLSGKNIKTCFAAVGITALPGPLPYHASEQIGQMTKLGHEVGSHTFSHRRISELTPEQLKEELTKSKQALELASGEPCTAFVPPWDKPQNLFSVAVDFKPGTFIPRKSTLSLRRIRTALRETGYSTYRTCPLTSRFQQLSLSKPELKDGMITIPCMISNGFGEKAIKLVERAIAKKGLAVIYAHPGKLASSGLESKDNFVSFIKFLHRKIQAGEIETILPRDLS